MTLENFRLIINIVILAINTTIIFRFFPKKYSLLLSVGMLTLATAAFFGFLWLADMLGTMYGMITGPILIPIFILSLKGKTSQIIYISILQIMTATLLSLLTNEILLIFVPVITADYYTMLLIVTIIVLMCYFALMFRYGRRFLERLFTPGSSQGWVLYTLVISFAYVTMVFVRGTDLNPVLYITLLLFILLSTYILCFAIINTNEKSKQKYDADFARDVIASGRDYYEKLTSVSEKLYIQQHDNKYHLNALQNLLAAGDTQSAQDYLERLNQKASDGQVTEYCNSRVINALLDSFAGRCAAQNIKLTISLVIPDDRAIDDYELCILLGNLLENAFAACLKLEANRFISLRTKLQGSIFGITVSNSYNGEVIIKDGELASTKPDGGHGIKSMQSVVKRHGGDFTPSWDAEVFRVMVVLNVAG